MTQKPNTGGAAFPDPGRSQSAKQRELLTDKGMTLRDYFAAKMMQSQLAMESKPYQDYNYENAAIRSYKMADAMLKAREVQ